MLWAPVEFPVRVFLRWISRQKMMVRKEVTVANQRLEERKEVEQLWKKVLEWVDVMEVLEKEKEKEEERFGEGVSRQVIPLTMEWEGPHSSSRQRQE